MKKIKPVKQEMNIKEKLAQSDIVRRKQTKKILDEFDLVVNAGKKSQQCSMARKYSDHVDPVIRLYAIRLLSNCYTSKIMDVLLRALSDHDDIVKIEALEVVEKYNVISVYREVLELLTFKNPLVRANAVLAMGAFDSDIIHTMLRKKFNKETHPFALCGYSETLYKYYEEENYLYTILEEIKPTSEIDVQRFAINSLGRCKNEKNCHVLDYLLQVKKVELHDRVAISILEKVLQTEV